MVMGYNNKDFHIVICSQKQRKVAKKHVKRLRRRAEQRELKGEHIRGAAPATRWGWWHA